MGESKLTFEELPQAVGVLDNKIDILLELMKTTGYSSRDKLMKITELSEYLPEKPAKPTIYGWTTHRQIPFEKHGKALYFRKSKIDEWLDNGRRIKI